MKHLTCEEILIILKQTQTLITETILSLLHTEMYILNI